jgi:hypothetical protein
MAKDATHWQRSGRLGSDHRRVEVTIESDGGFINYNIDADHDELVLYTDIELAGDLSGVSTWRCWASGTPISQARIAPDSDRAGRYPLL